MTNPLSLWYHKNTLRRNSTTAYGIDALLSSRQRVSCSSGVLSTALRLRTYQSDHQVPPTIRTSDRMSRLGSQRWFQLTWPRVTPLHERYLVTSFRGLHRPLYIFTPHRFVFGHRSCAVPGTKRFPISIRHKIQAFKFGRRVHFALRRKMRKPPITRVPAILNGLTNRPSWKTDSIYADIVKWRLTRPWMTSIQVNSKFEWRKWPLKSISTCIRMHFCLASYSVPESWHIFVK